MSDLTPAERERFQRKLTIVSMTHAQEGETCDCVMCTVAPKILTALDQLQRRLDTNVCNSGHVTLPLTLWDCPECHNQTRAEREALRVQVQELTNRLFELTQGLPSAVQKEHG